MWGVDDDGDPVAVIPIFLEQFLKLFEGVFKIHSSERTSGRLPYPSDGKSAG